MKKETKINKYFIVFLVIVLFGAGAFAYWYLTNSNLEEKHIVYNKDKKSTKCPECEECQKCEICNYVKLDDRKDAEYFDEYVKYFQAAGANNFLKNIDSFNNDQINTFLIMYFRNKMVSDNVSTHEMNVAKKEIDEVIDKYFGKIDYNLNNKNQREGWTKIDNNNYKFHAFPTGWMSPTYNNVGVNYDGNTVTLTYIVTKNYTENVGIQKIYLQLNNGNYNITKITYNEFKALVD